MFVPYTTIASTRQTCQRQLRFLLRDELLSIIPMVRHRFPLTKGLLLSSDGGQDGYLSPGGGHNESSGEQRGISQWNKRESPNNAELAWTNCFFHFSRGSVSSVCVA